MSKSETAPTAPGQVWEPQTGYLTDLYGAGSELLAQQPTESALTTQGREQATGYAGSPALQNLIQQSQSGLSTALNPQQNPMLQQAMQSAINPLTQAYQENVLGGITDQAVQAGQTGGSRQGIAEGIAGREYLQQVGDITSGMAYQDFAGGQERMLQGLGQAPTIANLGMMPADIMQQAGMQEQLAPWQQLQLQQGLIGGPTVLGGGGGGGTGGTSSAIGGIL